MATTSAPSMPYVHRLDEHLSTFGFDRGRLSLRPSEYFARQCFVSAEEEEPGLVDALERYPGSIVFASDYPHGDGTFPGSTKELLETDALSTEQLHGVMAGNAARLYGVS